MATCLMEIHVDGGVDGALPWGHSMSAMVMSMGPALGKPRVGGGVDGAPPRASSISTMVWMAPHLGRASYHLGRAPVGTCIVDPSPAKAGVVHGAEWMM